MYFRYCSYVLLTGWLVATISACTTDLCTRHSDCPPEAMCGAAGVCTAEPIVAVDAADSGIVDAMPSGADAMANIADAMAEADAMIGPDAMPSPDAMPFADGGASILDAGLVPPADAAVGGGLGIGPSPEVSGPGVFLGGSESGLAAVQPDAGGLAP